MPRPSEVAPRGPADFAEVLATAEPVMLVGGQAVNLWALYYEGRTRDLAPFVSRDVDVLGDREILTALGKVIGARPQFFPFRPPTNEVGVVVAKARDGEPLLVEVLRSVHGVTNEELKETAFTMALGDGRTQVRVPSPIVLLKAKIANATGLSQAGRQDGRHVTILARLMPAFLADLVAAAKRNQIAERILIERLEELLGVVLESRGEKLLRTLKIDARAFFAEIEPGELAKLAAFVSKRLPRAFRA